MGKERATARVTLLSQGGPTPSKSLPHPSHHFFRYAPGHRIPSPVLGLSLRPPRSFPFFVLPSSSSKLHTKPSLRFACRERGTICLTHNSLLVPSSPRFLIAGRCALRASPYPPYTALSVAQWPILLHRPLCTIKPTRTTLYNLRIVRFFSLSLFVSIISTSYYRNRGVGVSG